MQLQDSIASRCHGKWRRALSIAERYLLLVDVSLDGERA
jgi:hypothetical protein